MAPRFLGEFEQMVLLAILRLREEAYAVLVLQELDARPWGSSASWSPFSSFSFRRG